MEVSNKTITSVYVMEAGHAQSPDRYTAIRSTWDYEPLERLFNSKCSVPWFYVSNIPKKRSRKACELPCTLNTDKDTISELTFPNVAKYPCVAYGDVKGTNDAVLVVFSKCRKRICVLVFSVCKMIAPELWHCYISRGLNGELLKVRTRLRTVEMRSWR